MCWCGRAPGGAGRWTGDGVSGRWCRGGRSASTTSDSRARRTRFRKTRPRRSVRAASGAAPPRISAITPQRYIRSYVLDLASRSYFVAGLPRGKQEEHMILNRDLENKIRWTSGTLHLKPRPLCVCPLQCGFGQCCLRARCAVLGVLGELSVAVLHRLHCSVGTFRSLPAAGRSQETLWRPDP